MQSLISSQKYFFSVNSILVLAGRVEVETTAELILFISEKSRATALLTLIKLKKKIDIIEKQGFIQLDQLEQSIMGKGGSRLLDLFNRCTGSLDEDCVVKRVAFGEPELSEISRCIIPDDLREIRKVLAIT
ncbi:hypothetical protein ACFL1Y_00930 [Patescibacteria group bacterium]